MTRRVKIFGKFFRTMQFLAAFCMVLSLPGYAQTAKEKEKLQQSKQKLEEEIRYTNGLLEQTQKNKKASLNRLQILAKQIKSREALLRTINRELNEMNVTMAADSIRIARLSKQLQDLKSEYARMIRYAHRTMNGNNKLMFIFSARDFNQAYLRLKYYQQYAAYRRQQAARIESTQKAIHTHRMELEETRNLKLSLMVNKQSEKQKLDQEKTEKASAVKELTAKEKQLLATIKAKQQSAIRLEKAIEKLIADEIRASEERMRKKEAKTTKPSSGTGKGSKPSVMDFTPKEKELSNSFSANRGRLPWPCDRGFISGSFGEHAHSVLQHVKVKNNGIDIMTGQGTAVKSVFGGKVSKVMAFPGYNNVVIIRHGEFLTVYSNLGEVNVTEGQEVTVKQVIGKVYTGPGDQKTELHFELWHGKVIQNPEDWLAGR
jgi:septal ring factor EnvC (AmiA/AmiB activator)